MCLILGSNQTATNVSIVRLQSNNVEENEDDIPQVNLTVEGVYPENPYSHPSIQCMYIYRGLT